MLYNLFIATFSPQNYINTSMSLKTSKDLKSNKTLKTNDDLKERFEFLAKYSLALRWLTALLDDQQAQNTIKRHVYALQDYLRFCQKNKLEHESVTSEHIALYMKSLANRRIIRHGKIKYGYCESSKVQVRNSLRSYYDFLGETIRDKPNPLRKRISQKQGSQRAHWGKVSDSKAIWIPSKEEWFAMVDVMDKQTLRNNVMFALSYDAALRRAELCSLRIKDINMTTQHVHIRKENSKTQRERRVSFTAYTKERLEEYLKVRRNVKTRSKALFLSESRRNKAQAITYWTWTMVFRKAARQAGLPCFTPHTLRHMRLTYLAKQGVVREDITDFAGHQNPETTNQYIHLSSDEGFSQMIRFFGSL